VTLLDWLFFTVRRVKWRLGLRVNNPSSAFERPFNPFPGTSTMTRLFNEHDGRLITKWSHYPELYERHFAPFKGSPLRFLELGVQFGGSLELWRKYFGPEAVIFGIDIDPACADRVDSPSQVRIGSQADAAFLRSVVEEMGTPDIILDDGSHVAEHQIVSFQTLFPLLGDGGLYVIEDVCTSYWRQWHGGLKRKGTAIEFTKELIDNIHGWFWNGDVPDIAGIHVYNSIIFIEKAKAERPWWVINDPAARRERTQAEPPH
jgi:hypothetical protein